MDDIVANLAGQFDMFPDSYDLVVRNGLVVDGRAARRIAPTSASAVTA